MSKKTKSEKLFDALNNGARLTPLQIWKRFGIYAARQAIYALRTNGCTILTEKKRTKSGDQYVIYSME